MEPMREQTPPSGFLRGVGTSLKEIWGCRDLLALLTRREIRAKYKNSVLGMLWSLIRPLVLLLIYYIVIGKFLGAARGITNFAIYCYTGLAIWTLFSETVSAATGSIIGNSGIVKKIRLPREIFPLATTGSALFNFAIQFCILIVGALLTTGLMPGNWLLVPLAIVLIVVWGVALGLSLAAMNVYLRDVQYLVEVVLLIGFWVSPVVYSWTMVRNNVGPVLQDVYLLNPVTLAVMGMQKIIWAQGGPDAFPADLGTRMLVATAVGLVALFLSQRLFSRLQRNFAQEL